VVPPIEVRSVKFIALRGDKAEAGKNCRQGSVGRLIGSLPLGVAVKTQKTRGANAPGKAIAAVCAELEDLVSGPVEAPDKRARDRLHVRLCRLDVSSWPSTVGLGLCQIGGAVLRVPILALHEEAAYREPI
jgi:hypothetical protein